MNQMVVYQKEKKKGVKTTRTSHSKLKTAYKIRLK